jgi:hypothetical protein
MTLIFENLADSRQQSAKANPERCDPLPINALAEGY